MARVFQSEKHLAPERAIYRVARIDPTADQTWGVYLRSVLAFSPSRSSGCTRSFGSSTRIFSATRTRSRRCLGQSFNTAASFVTNTNWQSYSGESALGYVVAGRRTRRAELRLGCRRYRRRRRARARVHPQPHRSARATSGSTSRVSASGFCCRSRSWRNRSDRRRRHRDVGSLPHRDGPVRRHADADRRADRQPGSHQGTRHQRRRLLQRQLLSPVRKPHRLDELVRDLPPPGHQLLAATSLRPHGRATSARGSRSSRS